MTSDLNLLTKHCVFKQNKWVLNYLTMRENFS